LRLGDIPTKTPALGMRQAILGELHAVAPELPILGIRTWREYIRDFSTPYWTMRVGAGLFAVLSGLALALAGIGVFGMKACLVAQRTREIGIRMALGATRCQTLWLVLREGFLSSLAGTGVGLVLVWMGTRFMRSLLFDVGTLDPCVLAFTALVLTLAVLLASYIPARRAARIDPMVALRYE